MLLESLNTPLTCLNVPFYKTRLNLLYRGTSGSAELVIQGRL